MEKYCNSTELTLYGAFLAGEKRDARLLAIITFDASVHG
jgi:hypothetical protein